MTLPLPADIHATVAATWPPANITAVGPFLIRNGQGGGSRVCAATVTGPVVANDLPLAEAAMRNLGQAPTFMVRDGEDALDLLLAGHGYAVKDPVMAYVAPVAALTTQRPPPVTTFEVWPPLAVQAEIWAAGGIGPARLAIMDRAPGPKTTILGRLKDSPAGAAFVACAGPLAMIHAIEVLDQYRRQGLATHILRAAAFWAADQGASDLSLVVTDANVAARQAYATVGMEPVGRYHYRVLPA